MVIFLPAAMASARNTAAASMCSRPDGAISAASSLDSSRGVGQAARGVQARQHGVDAALAQHFGSAERAGAGGDAGHGSNRSRVGRRQNLRCARRGGGEFGRRAAVAQHQPRPGDAAAAHGGQQRGEQRRASSCCMLLQPERPVGGERRFGQAASQTRTGCRRAVPAARANGAGRRAAMRRQPGRQARRQAQRRGAAWRRLGRAPRPERS